ncbi:hypothetical protein KSP39_PZI020274 [Platanthera zijinensis]|uniref:Uncharacterized protein n=1 Tax=Platanthera zijinensis TaxID=2320716 RepID=A0AAP0FXA7_9ASPA
MSPSEIKSIFVTTEFSRNFLRFSPCGFGRKKCVVVSLPFLLPLFYACKWWL